MGYGKFQKVVVENAIFQDLKIVGKEKIFTLAIEKFWIFFIKIS